jgi:hypothetical protein
MQRDKKLYIAVNVLLVEERRGQSSAGVEGSREHERK